MDLISSRSIFALVLVGVGTSAQYDQCTGNTSWIGDGFCNNDNNIAACGYDGGDCCYCTCFDGAGFSCDVFALDCRDPEHLGDEVSDCSGEHLVNVPCSTETSTQWTVTDAASANALMDAIRCSGGAFNVQWLGHVVVNRTISVANGTVLNMTGVGTGAEIQAASSGIRLFTVINASLGLKDMRITGGKAAFGGAIGANSSHIYLQNTSFSSNNALVEGGAIYAAFSSIASSGQGVLFGSNNAGGKGGALCLRGASKATFYGNTAFRNNTAIGDAGALCAYESNVSFGGHSVFLDNFANRSGGALHVYSSSVFWTGDAVFMGNTAKDNGGALRASSSTVSWASVAGFFDNSAYSSGGSLYAWNSTVLWAGNTVFSDNTGINGAGGAVRVSSSTVSLAGAAVFGNNTANESGGALRIWNSTVSWATNSSFFRNSANVDGGALHVRASSVSWAGHVRFSDNTANSGDGGALGIWDSTVSWASDAEFSNNTANDGGGGALFVRESIVSWAGHAGFSDNTAKRWGGAMYASSSTLSWARNAIFSNNTAGEFGGALYISSSNVSWVGDAEFSGNTANEWGGALYVSSSSNISWMGEAVLSHNTANDHGGGLYARDYSTASWRAQSFFLSNTAGRNGGALYITDGARALLKLDTEFLRNSALGDGGALYVYSNGDDVQPSSVHIDGSAKFIDNVCGGDGGALVVIDAGSVMFATQSVTFLNNSAHAAGGAVAVKGLVVGPHFTGLTFVLNHAQIGGAAYVTSSGTAITEDEMGHPKQNPTTFDGCKFISNTASATGGALDTGAGLDVITNSHFTANSARAGGALRLAGITSLNNCTFTENTSYNGEGVAVSNVGSISSIASCSFIDNTVTCEPGEFVDYNDTSPSSSVFDIVCKGCDAKCHQCVTSPRAPGCTKQLKHTKSLGGDTTIEALQIDIGFWRATNTSRKVLACYNPDACLGGVTRESNYCSAGYEGPYCSICREGYSPGLGYTCSRCSRSIGSVAGTVTIFVSAVAGVLLVLFFITRNRSTGGGGGLLTSMRRQVGSLKTVIIVWQVTTQFASVTNVVYPKLYQRFLKGIEIFNFDLGWIVSAECIIDLDFHHRLIISTLGPPVAFAILGGMYAMAMHRNRAAQDVFLVTARIDVRQKYLSLVLLLTILVYSSASSTLFRMFACEKLDDDKSYLRADYRIDCNSPKHIWWQVYAGCMIIVYTGGIPALYSLLLFRNRETLTNERARQEDAVVKSISNLWELYKPNRYYYELIECGRRILLAGMVVFIFPNTTAQVGVALMIAIFFMVLSEMLAPYESERDAWVSRIGHAIVFGSVYLALLLKIDVSDEREDSQRVFEVVLIAAHVCMLLFATFGGVLITCQWIKRDH